MWGNVSWPVFAVGLVQSPHEMARITVASFVDQLATVLMGTIGLQSL